MGTLALRDLGRQSIVRPGVAPGCALATAVRRGDSGDAFDVSSGATGIASPSRQTLMFEDTLFDLASVTKPFVAATFARLWVRGLLSPHTPLGALVAEAAGSASEDVPLALLLSHRAGLMAHVELFDPLRRGLPMDRSLALRQAASARREGCSGPPPPEGFPPLYSDVGYLLVGRALEAATGRPLDEIVDEEVCRPLRLEVASARLWEKRTPDRLFACVETETVDFRGGPVIGAVHDENAWAMSGSGISGHAGLFGTASSVASFGAAMLSALSGRRSAFLPPSIARWLVAPRPGGTLRAGFDGKSAGGSSAGSRVSALAFGHLGFTGTSLWCDPAAEIAMVILTNRVCPSRDNVAIRLVRPRLGDALFDLADRGRRRQDRVRLRQQSPRAAKNRSKSGASALAAWPLSGFWAG